MELHCCWHNDQITPDDCPFLREGEDDLLFNRKQRFLRRCLECPRFLEDVRTAAGRLDGLADLFPYTLEEILDLRARLQSLSGQFEARNREIEFLHEVGLVLQTSIGVDEVIAMALTAVTAGKGFGLNRAILLLVDRERQNLVGYFAIGPREEAEAGRIWQEIAERDLTLREMARLFFEQKMSAERAKFQDLLTILTTPLARRDHLFVRTLNEQVSRHVHDLAREPDLDPQQRDALGVREMILVPLTSKNRRIGLLLADNRITGRPIEESDLRSLENFVLPVSFAIERASLHERLQEELDKVTEANRRLQDQQETILRMEKMALVGKITSGIAHSIRNPLTIIGGFARTLLRSIPAEDSRRRHIESIVREARRLESTLEEVLNYNESLHPTLDWWDVNQLVTGIYAGLQDDLDLFGVRGRLQIQPDLPRARIDFKKIGFCLRSLVQSVLENSQTGGELEIRTGCSDDSLLIAVAHSGPPLRPELVEQLAAPCVEPGDSSVGAALCCRVLQEHGGRLDVAASPGAETVFTIAVPIHGPRTGLPEPL